jgi:uncharacterized protein
MELDRYLWADKDHVSFAQLSEWFTRYLYLPRVRNRDTLARAVQDGATRMYVDDTFVVASGWDEEKKRYRGLKLGGGGAAPLVEKGTLLVKPAVARQQQAAERPGIAPPAMGVPPTGQPTPALGLPAMAPGSVPPPKPLPNLFVGSVRLDSARVGRDAGRVAEEVIQHLSTLPSAEAEVTLEIRVRVPGGVKDDVVRTVQENARTLKFGSHGFERE